MYVANPYLEKLKLLRIKILVMENYISPIVKMLHL